MGKLIMLSALVCASFEVTAQTQTYLAPTEVMPAPVLTQQNPVIVQQTPIVVQQSATVVGPPGVIYVAPTYPAPDVGFVWSYHPRYGWGWRHPHHGWHRGWR